MPWNDNESDMSESPKQMAASQCLSLADIERKLEAMATEWAGIDEFNSIELRSLAQRVKEVSKNLMAGS